MIKMWVLDRLDQCTVVGIAGLRSDGSSILHGLPDVGRRVVVIRGSASDAVGKVLVPALGWAGLLVVGVALLGGAVAVLVISPISGN